jgi:hypothetical protein
MSELNSVQYQGTRFPYLNLPGELRNTVLTQITEWQDQVALANTCHQLRQEILPYTLRTLNFRTRGQLDLLLQLILAGKFATDIKKSMIFEDPASLVHGCSLDDSYHYDQVQFI